MALRKTLTDFVDTVMDEAEQNPKFAEQLRVLFDPSTRSKTKKRARRRAPATLNPISLASQGEEVLRTRLVELTLDQLKDIVAEYGMDQKRLIMKWRTPERIIDKIVCTSIARAHKGQAFQ